MWKVKEKTSYVFLTGISMESSKSMTPRGKSESIKEE